MTQSLLYQSIYTSGTSEIIVVSIIVAPYLYPDFHCSIGVEVAIVCLPTHIAGADPGVGNTGHIPPLQVQ